MTTNLEKIRQACTKANPEIMELKDQVCSLELSKKLKELGVKRESLFSWSAREGIDGKITDDSWYISTSPFRDDIPSFHSEDCDAHISAFTVTELGEMLPHYIELKGIHYQLFTSVALGSIEDNMSERQKFVVYANEENYNDNAPFPFMMEYNEANARAKMLVYLLENKLITL